MTQEQPEESLSFEMLPYHLFQEETFNREEHMTYTEAYPYFHGKKRLLAILKKEKVILVLYRKKKYIPKEQIIGFMKERKEQTDQLASIERTQKYVDGGLYGRRFPGNTGLL